MIKAIYHKLFSLGFRNNLRFSLLKLRSKLYNGAEVSCNCCDHTFSKFLPFGDPSRENAACPYCNSLERHRVLMDYLIEVYKIQEKNPEVLHFAPERYSTIKLKRISKSKKYITADIHPDLADQVVDIESMPFETHSFDLILCSHVLAHVKNENQAIREIKRVLRPEGVALIQTKIFDNLDQTDENLSLTTPESKLTYFGQDDLWRKHGKDFNQRLQKGGLMVKEIDHLQAITPAQLEKYGVSNTGRELIYYCTN